MNASEINQQKVVQSKALLKEIIKAPAIFLDDDKLLKSLRSQGGFAKLEALHRGIICCSLNTMKTTSNQILERGFSELNELRNNALDSIEKAKVGTKINNNTRTGLKCKIDDYQKKNVILMNRHNEMRNIISVLQAELKRISCMDFEKERLAQYDFVIKKTNEMLMLGVHEELS